MLQLADSNKKRFNILAHLNRIMPYVNFRIILISIQIEGDLGKEYNTRLCVEQQYAVHANLVAPEFRLYMNFDILTGPLLL